MRPAADDLLQRFRYWAWAFHARRTLAVHVVMRFAGPRYGEAVCAICTWCVGDDCAWVRKPRRWARFKCGGAVGQGRGLEAVVQHGGRVRCLRGAFIEIFLVLASPVLTGVTPALLWRCARDSGFVLGRACDAEGIDAVVARSRGCYD